MATDTAAIQKIKTLKGDAAKIGGFHEWFAKSFADKQHHDKQNFGFKPRLRTGLSSASSAPSSP